MDRPVIDQCGPAFARLTREILPRLRRVFGTASGEVVIYPSSGTGAWEAALTNVLAPGNRVLALTNGHFRAGFAQAARSLGFGIDEVPLPWGEEVPGEEVERRLRADRGADPYRVLLVVHNETSTGVALSIADVRRAIDAAGHDALLIVDAMSSLASVDFRLDEWRVDVALSRSQKGLMLPPELGIVCAGRRAIDAAENGGSPRSFFDWRPISATTRPASSRTRRRRCCCSACARRSGCSSMRRRCRPSYARHEHLASAVGAGVEAWGLPILCQRLAFRSNTLTAVMTAAGVPSDRVIEAARERFGLSLGVGLGQVSGKLFRIGHLGALNDLEVIATIGGIEMALRECGVAVELGVGVAACQKLFARDKKRSPDLEPVAAGG